ncbi:uncharacterized protein K452DRAFT_291944 [Aplosporella prunicola CBS 121167]|uniref:AA1-like domain-containing protein n=1 Tax=Aplosporella prunicola CBS 121167 TaxID=1176127 RepID=A0A6A6B1A1_9PEZI|nr:uncharacterized protein K452DRAFT_291944 [Aplosporella prunicola CBS 121167]KAF2137035.1 hypothetical protein K452DRAFT_291944 [Aplosporella prunicola CBS 121167]
MQFFAATAILFAGIAAAETITVKDLSIRDNKGIQAATFTINPGNIECSATKAADIAPPKIQQCGVSHYYFNVAGSDSKYTINFTEDLKKGPVGGEGKAENVPVVCHAGGNGPDDFVCTQVGDISVDITETTA